MLISVMFAVADISNIKISFIKSLVNIVRGTTVKQQLQA